MLIVDDHVDALEALVAMLEMQGFEVIQAGDALTALTVAEERRPKVAILDIGLPDIDGYRLAERLRQQPRGQDMKLIALTGHGQPEDIARALAAGFDDHILKPACFDELSGKVQSPRPLFAHRSDPRY